MVRHVRNAPSPGTSFEIIALFLIGSTGLTFLDEATRRQKCRECGRMENTKSWSHISANALLEERRMSILAGRLTRHNEALLFQMQSSVSVATNSRRACVQ